VLINGNTFVPAPPDLGQNRIKILLPSQAGVLRAGVQGVQVVHEIYLGDPLVAHRGVESNVAAFILHPKLDPPVSPASGTITLTFDPHVGRSQRVTLLLGESNPPAGNPGRAYSIAAPPENGITTAGQTETAAIKFSLANVDPGDYLVRVQVDGAESSFGVDSAGRFSAPIVTITPPPP
jgi:hypothetical protein